jgi:methionyl aminopeptidase
MITIKDKRSREKMAVAGKMLAEIFVVLEEHIKTGISTLELDSIIAGLMQKMGLISQSKGYLGYKHVSCISINDEVVHGVPHEHKKLSRGDLLKIDICAAYDGYCADMARCFFVETKKPEAEKLVTVAISALNKGIEKAIAGNRLGDISAAIQREVESSGFGVVRDFAGHGIGKRMHEEPEILNYGQEGKGPLLRPGMAFALEPMITWGHYDIFVMPDGWTAKTKDGSLAAHVEDTVVITENGPHIITRLA